MNRKKPVVRALFPVFCTGDAISRCLLYFGDHFASQTYGFEYWSTGVQAAERRPYHRTPYGALATRIAFALPGGETRISQRLDQAYVKSLQPGDIAYLWPGCSLDVHRAARERGAIVVTEMVNSAGRNYRRVIGEAHAKWGVSSEKLLSEAAIEQEEARLALSDYVFSPSPLVTETLVSVGVARERILQTSYAWDVRQFEPSARRAREPDAGPVFLWVALGSIRKGLPELLEAWSRARTGGTLRLVGAIEPNVREISAKHLARPDVEHIPFTTELAPLYASADVFVLASHEEGSPIVAYFALAAGLPVVASPAVASGIVDDEVHGLVRAPSDADGWVKALERIASDAELRRRMGAASRARSHELTWAAVTARRCAALESIASIEKQGRARPEVAVAAV